MASSTAKLYYQRLNHEIWFDEEENVIRRLRQSRLRRLPIRRKLRVRIPRLRRFLRRKVKQVKGAWNKVCKRLKESQSHFGDLFAGNYLFMQVTPTPLQYATEHGGGINKSFGKSHDNHNLGSYSSTRLSDVPRIA